MESYTKRKSFGNIPTICRLPVFHARFRDSSNSGLFPSQYILLFNHNLITGYIRLFHIRNHYIRIIFRQYILHERINRITCFYHHDEPLPGFLPGKNTLFTHSYLSRMGSTRNPGPLVSRDPTHRSRRIRLNQRYCSLSLPSPSDRTCLRPS